MGIFEVHTTDTAQGAAVDELRSIEKANGFIPNLYGVFAESPAVLKAYVTLGKIFDESSFSPAERQIIILAVSRYNECRYCIAAHTVVAGMQNVPATAVEAIRRDQPIPDSRLEALRQFATTVVEKRGWVSEAEVTAFLDAGFTKAQILEVVLGVSLKTLSNYANHIADTPLDDAFSPKAWTPGAEKLAS